MARQYTKRRLTVERLRSGVIFLEEIYDQALMSGKITDMECFENDLKELANECRGQKPGPKLSKTTQEVDRLLLEGKTPKEISERLKTSLSTVRRRLVLNRLAKEKDGANADREIPEKTRQEGGDMA